MLERKAILYGSEYFKDYKYTLKIKFEANYFHVNTPVVRKIVHSTFPPLKYWTECHSYPFPYLINLSSKIQLEFWLKLILSSWK